VIFSTKIFLSFRKKICLFVKKNIFLLKKIFI
jgi:hypothetical protein